MYTFLYSLKNTIMNLILPKLLTISLGRKDKKIFMPSLSEQTQTMNGNLQGQVIKLAHV